MQLRQLLHLRHEIGPGGLGRGRWWRRGRGVLLLHLLELLLIRLLLLHLFELRLLVGGGHFSQEIDGSQGY
jgi:hypothetical protein